MRRFCLTTLSAFALLFVLALPACAQFGKLGGTGEQRLQRAPINWDSVNEALSKELATEDIGVLAKRALAARIPQDAAGWLRRLALLIRADYRQDALAMLTSRPRALTRKTDWNLSQAAGSAIRYRFPRLALRLCELFPEEWYSSEIIDSALATLPPGRIDPWLAKQGAQGQGEWLEARIRQGVRRGTEGPLMAAEEKRVRAHPDDLEALNRYLRAVRICADQQRKYDIGWLSAFCRPRLAVTAFLFGNRLQESGGDPIPLYQHSLHTPFTPRDSDRYRDYVRRMQFASGGDPKLTERQLRDWTLTALMNVYKEQGEYAKAQAILETLTAHNKGGLPDPYQAFGAGQTQAGSGARVIEQRVLQAEKQADNQNSPAYWLERGLYYSGRKEDNLAVEAFEKALKLAPIPVTGDPITPRWDIVQAYERHLWLRNIDRPTDMLALLHRELDVAPPDGAYAEVLFQDLATRQTESLHTIDSADPRLWAFLAAQQDWSHFVLLLETIYKSATLEQQEHVMQRLAALTKGGPTSRAYTLGEMEVLLGEPQRAIPVLEEALPRATTAQQSWELYFTLWKAKQRLNDWQGMAEILSKNPLAGNLLDVANTAAESGEPQAAMRYFRRWINQDRRRFAEFPRKPNPGLTELLRSYYHELSREEPRCATPTMATQLLAPPGP